MIQEFLTYQRDIKGLSELTIQAYKKDLEDFVRFARIRGLKWSTMTKQDVDAYHWELKGERLMKPTSINRHLCSIRALSTWAQHEGILPYNFAQYVQSERTSQPLPQGVAREKVLEYLDKPANTERAKLIHLLTALLIDTGCRLGEVISLRIEDFDARTVKVRGKGGKERIVYFTERTVKAMQPFIKCPNMPYLLPQYAQWTYREYFYDEMRTVGLHTHPHALRHTFATEMLNRGADLKVVSTLLGHSSVKTTERYARVANPTAREQYERYAH